MVNMETKNRGTKKQNGGMRSQNIEKDASYTSHIEVP
jgi:hypothetical protein